MKTVRDACELQPNALSIKLSDQVEQLDELIVNGHVELNESRHRRDPARRRVVFR